MFGLFLIFDVENFWMGQIQLKLLCGLVVTYGPASHHVAEFVVSFFSGSHSLALKVSLKSPQMTRFYIQNED